MLNPEQNPIVMGRSFFPYQLFSIFRSSIHRYSTVLVERSFQVPASSYLRNPEPELYGKPCYDGGNEEEMT
jgi:hypothetical protein